MSLAANKPDLRRIGESAFAEVLGTMLSLSATVGNSDGHTLLAGAADQITCSVLLTGPRLSGSVCVKLPRDFVTHAARLLTGVDGGAVDDAAVLEDAAGELANMVGGRIAAQLAECGYRCTLGTPTVADSARRLIQNQPGVECGRTELICEGHRLLLEIQCRYVVP